MPALHTDQSVDLCFETFSRQGSFVGKDLLGRGEQDRRSNARRFSLAVHSIFWFVLFCVFFGSLFFIKGKFVFFVVPKTLKRGFALSDDGYRTIIYTQNLNIAQPLKKKTCYSDTILYIQIRGFFLVLLIVRIFSISIFPAAFVLSSHPVLVLQTLICFVVWHDFMETHKKNCK